MINVKQLDDLAYFFYFFSIVDDIVLLNLIRDAITDEHCICFLRKIDIRDKIELTDVEIVMKDIEVKKDRHRSRDRC